MNAGRTVTMVGRIPPRQESDAAVPVTQRAVVHAFRQAGRAWGRYRVALAQGRPAERHAAEFRKWTAHAGELLEALMAETRREVPR